MSMSESEICDGIHCVLALHADEGAFREMLSRKSIRRFSQFSCDAGPAVATSSLWKSKCRNV